LKAIGYEVYLFYYWLRNADVAIQRVAERVKAGGHHIPETDIRRRYSRSVHNFFVLYQPIATEWRVYDNSERYSRMIGFGYDGEQCILDGDTWLDFERSAAHD
jgi:predicted ABC-type ATPase